MASDTLVASLGTRGFRSFHPPPPGCVGWTKSESDENTLGHDVAAEMAIPTGVSAQGGETVEPRELDVVPSEVGDPLPSKLFTELSAELSPPHLGPAKDASHIKAAAAGDVMALRSNDSRLRVLLDDDKGVLDDEDQAVGALKLYQDTLGVFDAGPRVKLKAFQAVSRDDAETLSELFDWGGLELDARNKGGQTLLEVAVERRRPRVQELLHRRMTRPSVEDSVRSGHGSQSPKCS
eukprot:TRINITY_DN74826_c0_g1_i1.p1 TRINITY_DN74826_c0_g1~~TRINITY_DN74826_c0_g1_i1.p1  ORF type:complete len:254 (+),score=42.36 TRINITY_DN74826_c0_g1_i1:57-764(+)